MPTDRFVDPLPEATYHGFSDAAGPPPRRPRPSWMSGRSLAIGAGVAIAAGIALGVWAKPDLGKDPTAAAERSATPVPIEVGKPAPPDQVQSAGKLEVLSPDQAAAARAANVAPAAMAPSAGYMPGPPPSLPEVVRAPSYAAAPAPMMRQPPPLAVDPPRPAQMANLAANRPGPDCSGARGAAEAMVCGDPDLAAADRELNTAYRRALRSGVPPGAVRADQRDWLNIREDAARHSRRALASVYQQRIDELNAMADGGDDGPD